MANDLLRKMLIFLVEKIFIRTNLGEMIIILFSEIEKKKDIARDPDSGSE